MFWSEDFVNGVALKPSLYLGLLVFSIFFRISYVIPIVLSSTFDDILQASDPTSSKYTMGYVYDSFSWPHCSAAGYDFTVALETLYVSGGTETIFRSSKDT